MDKQMKRFERRYINVEDYKVKFTWVSKSSGLIKATVLEKEDGMLGKRFKKVYSETFTSYLILNYHFTAEKVVQSYLNENLKWQPIEFN